MIWKQIEDFNYEINSEGAIRNTKTGKYLKPYDNGNGYFAVELYKNGKHYVRLFHRLYLTYFGEGEVRAHVNHKDGNPANNSLDNLEWASESENHKHRFHVLKRQVKRDEKTGRFLRT